MAMTTLDLANAYATLGDGLDDLFNKLRSNGQFGLAQQVKNAENDIEQAGLDLNAIDAIAQLSQPADQQKLEDLSDKMNADADKIADQESRVAAICQLATSLVSVVAHFKDADPLGAIASAQDAFAKFKALTG